MPKRDPSKNNTTAAATIAVPIDVATPAVTPAVVASVAAPPSPLDELAEIEQRAPRFARYFLHEVRPQAGSD